MPPGQEGSLRKKLVKAKNSFALGDSTGAIEPLNAFINHIGGLSGGRHLSTAEAEDLIAQAQAIIDAIALQ